MPGRIAVGGNLHLPAARIPAQHVRFEEIGVAVGIDVADGHRHPRVARGPQSVPWDEAEAAVAVVQPELVGVFEIVRDVEIGSAVAVEIGEHGGEAEVLAFFGQGPALLVPEARVSGDRLAREVAPAVIPVEEIGIGALL